MNVKIPVQSKAGSYVFEVGPGLTSRVGEWLRAQDIPRSAVLFLITDTTVQSLSYPDAILASCRANGYTIYDAAVPPRDESKCLQVAEELYMLLLDAGVRRNGVVLAVGGGVVGDLAGFVAATYQRGIRFVQIPTTLLAHDSSIGGKVGINLPRGKNLVGAFHAPIGILYDVDTLATLPDREWQGGMAEAIKHGIIGDASLFEELEQHPLIAFPGPEKATSLVARASAVKIKIVEQDEQESGLRMVLNVGHTVGHAVEQVSHYSLNHGEGVAIGLSVEAELAVSRGLLSAEDAARIRRVLALHGLPVAPPNYPLEDILTVLNLDKKHAGDGWTFALPKRIGEVVIVRDVVESEVVSAWEATKMGGVHT